jgi:hypothetical protein
LKKCCTSDFGFLYFLVSRKEAAVGVYLRNGSPYWYYSFTVHGRRFSGTTKTESKSLARQIAEAKKTDLLRDQVGLKIVKRMTLDDLAKEFLEWSKSHKRSYNRDVVLAGHLSAFLGKKDIADISSLDVEVQEVPGTGGQRLDGESGSRLSQADVQSCDQVGTYRLESSQRRGILQRAQEEFPLVSRG